MRSFFVGVLTAVCTANRHNGGRYAARRTAASRTAPLLSLRLDRLLSRTERGLWPCQFNGHRDDLGRERDGLPKIKWGSCRRSVRRQLANWEHRLGSRG
jgi:hypothetical protein